MSPPSLSVIPWVNARLCVRAPWVECEDIDGAKTLFGRERKQLPAPLCWHWAQSLLAFPTFRQIFCFEAVRTFSPHERLTGKSGVCVCPPPPHWVTAQVNLINAITELATNHTKMRFIKAQISMQLQRGAPWLGLIDMIINTVSVHSSILESRS